MFDSEYREIFLTIILKYDIVLVYIKLQEVKYDRECKTISKLYDLTQRAEKVGISDDDVLREILVEKMFRTNINHDVNLLKKKNQRTC